MSVYGAIIIGDSIHYLPIDPILIEMSLYRKDCNYSYAWTKFMATEWVKLIK